MRAKTIGITLFILGAAYLLFGSWLLSWWYCPAYLAAAQSSQAQPGILGNDAVTIFWAFSGPLGAVLVAAGLFLSSRAQTRRMVALLSFLVVFLVWVGWPGSFAFHAPVFGVGGGLILVCFLTTAWHLNNTRRRVSGRFRTAADFRLLAYVSFFTSAWGLCGILGVPSLALRPEMAQHLQTHSMTVAMAVKVLVCLVIGWLLLALSHWIEATSRREDA
ncbi:MAG: hypothetical protein KAY24_02190 [Candidatus Eisenbacteria sp.]|nr:hypothetical protein [Candidatus Eisenbacteria bacterium]